MATAPSTAARPSGSNCRRAQRLSARAQACSRSPLSNRVLRVVPAADAAGSAAIQASVTASRSWAEARERPHARSVSHQGASQGSSDRILRRVGVCLGPTQHWPWLRRLLASWAKRWRCAWLQDGAATRQRSSRSSTRSAGAPRDSVAGFAGRLSCVASTAATPPGAGPLRTGTWAGCARWRCTPSTSPRRAPRSIGWSSSSRAVSSPLHRARPTCSNCSRGRTTAKTRSSKALGESSSMEPSAMSAARSSFVSASGTSGMERTALSLPSCSSAAGGAQASVGPVGRPVAAGSGEELCGGSMGGTAGSGAASLPLGTNAKRPASVQRSRRPAESPPRVQAGRPAGGPKRAPSRARGRVAALPCTRPRRRARRSALALGNSGPWGRREEVEEGARRWRLDMAPRGRSPCQAVAP